VPEQRGRQQTRPSVHAVKHRSTSYTNTDVSVRSAEKCLLSVERSKEAQQCSSGSVRELNVRAHNLSWTQGAAEAQEPAGRTARSRLHAQRCTLSAIRSGTRYAKWAGGSRSQTHRRAAMCGFTEDDGCVRGVAPTHERSSGSFLDFLLATSARPKASRT
jgi:hypothetical protein